MLADANHGHPRKFVSRLPKMPCMTHEPPNFSGNDPVRDEARALEASIRAIRRAQGKRNPEDFPPGSPECLAIMEEFVRDVGRVRALDISNREGDDDSHLDGAGATG